MEISKEYQERLARDLPNWEKLNSTKPEYIEEICKLYRDIDKLREQKNECTGEGNSNYERLNNMWSAKVAILSDLLDSLNISQSEEIHRRRP